MIIPILLAIAALTAPSGPQSGGWVYYDEADGVEVYYSVRINSDEARVAWKCVNTTSSDASCSVGAGQNKVYRCLSNGLPVGFTEALGERATVRAQGEYAFPSESACRGKAVTGVEPFGVRISIEH